MEQADPRDVQALEELQNKLMQYRLKLKTANQQYANAINIGRRAALVERELQGLPDDTRTYAAVGRAYILAPKAALEHEQMDKLEATASEVTRLKDAKEKLEAGAKETEDEIRELIKHSPILLQNLMR